MNEVPASCPGTVACHWAISGYPRVDAGEERLLTWPAREDGSWSGLLVHLWSQREDTNKCLQDFHGLRA